MRDYNRMTHLHSVLQKTNLRRHDIVVMTVRGISTGAGRIRSWREPAVHGLRTRIVHSRRDDGGKRRQTVDLLVVPGVNPFDAMVQTAAKLQASRLVTGVSARWIPKNWRGVSDRPGSVCPSRGIAFSLEIITPGRPSIFVNLGPHPPRLWPEDVDLVHEMWLELSEKYAGAKLHHRDMVGVAFAACATNSRMPNATKWSTILSKRSNTVRSRNQQSRISSNAAKPATTGYNLLYGGC